MIFTDYYKFEKLPSKSKTRLDCVASTGSYLPLEGLRPLGRDKGRIHISLLANYTRAKEEKLSDWALDAPDPVGHITSLCKIGTGVSLYYGDFRGKEDAMIIKPSTPSFIADGVIEGTAFEVFIARGYKADMLNLYNECLDGELDGEMESLRNIAKPEGETPLFG